MSQETTLKQVTSWLPEPLTCVLVQAHMDIVRRHTKEDELRPKQRK